MKELFIRTLTGIQLIVLVAGAILLGPLVLAGMLLVIALVGMDELRKMERLKATPPLLAMGFSAALLIPVTLLVWRYQWSPWWFAVVLPGWLAGMAWSRLPRPGVLMLLWIALPLASFLALGYAGGDGRYLSPLPLSVIALIWINDTFAYLSGSGLGRHPMTPGLSPGKTWEGMAGGLMATLLGGFALSKLTGLFVEGRWALVALLVSLLALAGDLFESAMKRQAKVKDSGSLLPGHGGVLDRFDSLLFVSPVLLLLFHLFNSLI